MVDMLKLKNLEDYRDEILKAEIGALLFNLGKTHIGFWHKKDGQDFWLGHFNITTEEDKFKEEFKQRFGYCPFDDYEEYYKEDNELGTSPFEYEIEQCGLKDFVFNQKVKIPFNLDNINQLEWIIFFKGKAVAGNKEVKEFVKKVFLRGCENINSGIDKGSPREQVNGTLWISNAFGSFKSKPELQDFDQARLCFYKKFYCFLYSNGYFTNPDWKEIRRFIVCEIKNWYSRLLSDSRFPVNDVTLWDQAYMTASMFKAVMAELYMDSSRLNGFLSNPVSIKWRILGVQYDKLGLSERGYRPAQIQWYRETARRIDERIKKLLEYDYPIGNEIYRDETGIYFLIGEILGEGPKDNELLGELHPDLNEIYEKILQIFKDESLDEFYPAIFVTKASRGLMTLGYLIDEARANFLKIDWSKKENDICFEKSISGRSVGICQLCGHRLVFESDRMDEDKDICGPCYENKTRGRIKEWLKDTSGETIWMDELKDEHGRVALVTMKFELKHWLNGNMLNSFLINQADYWAMFDLCKKTIKGVKELYIKNAFNLNTYRLKNGEFNQQLALEVENIIVSISDQTLLQSYGKNKLYLENGNLRLVDKSNNQKDLKELLNNKKFETFIKIFDFKLFKLLAREAYTKCRGNKETFDDFIRQIFFGSVIGTYWEDWIKQTSFNSKINWHEEIIDWSRLTEGDIEFFSAVLLQLLLRKNPSPARLRRVWESTKEFFEEIERNICDYAGIPEERKIRYYWYNSGIPEGEYYDGDAIFWSDPQNTNRVYLISYLKDLKETFELKRYGERYSSESEEYVSRLCLRDGKKETYRPYMSIIDPTPVSWQFIIPAKYVPNLIDNVMKKYDEHFKFVYGKLPLHIGVVVQDYKKPLYVGIKALRRIRRDIRDIDALQVKVKASQVADKLKCQRFEEKIFEEKINDTQNYYSLYWGEHTDGYEFYLKMSGDEKFHKEWICCIDKIEEDRNIYIIPNTFDFEFLDTNVRRNDIRYVKESRYKRAVELKSNRPYEIETYWSRFKAFKEIFGEGRYLTKLQKLVTMIYDGLDLEENSLAGFMTSAFINVLELKKDKNMLSKILKILDINESSVKSDNKLDIDKLYEQLAVKLNRENLKLFLDMFEFWHRLLKEV